MVYLDGGIPWGKVNSAQSKALMQFCLRRSKYIVLPREHTEKIEESAVEKLKYKAIEEVKQRRERQIRYIKTLSPQQLEKDGFLSLNWGIDNITTNAKQEIKELQQIRANFKKEDTLMEDLAEWGLVKREYATSSFTTYCPRMIWDLCYFDKEQVDLRAQRKNIFAYPLYMGEYEFEDPAFADREGHVWMCICSHEGTFSMELTEADYKEFEKMNIRHFK